MVIYTCYSGIPGKGVLVLSGAFPDSVEIVAIGSLSVDEHVDWSCAIVRISNQDGDDVTWWLLDVDWWGVERLSFYIVSKLHWRAQLRYVSNTRH